jgi:hypothetical protein
MPIINTLICHRDIESASVCLQSFLLACEGQAQFRFFSDGSLTEEDEKRLEKQFPNSILVQREVLRSNVEPLLKDHPLCSEVSQSSIYSLKLIEIPLYCHHHLGEERFVYIDTDIMFFRVMSNWQEIWKRNVLLFERRVMLSGPPRVILKRSHVLLDVNSGLISFEMRYYDLDFVEWFLSQDDIRTTFFFEQTCWALLAAYAKKKGAVFYQPHADQIVSDHAFKNLREGQVGLHFIAGLKARVTELTPFALGQRTQETSPQTINFIESKFMSYLNTLITSVANRSCICRWILRQP